MRQLQCSSQKRVNFQLLFLLFYSMSNSIYCGRHFLLVHTPPTGINAWVVICRPDVRWSNMSLKDEQTMLSGDNLPITLATCSHTGPLGTRLS